MREIQELQAILPVGTAFEVKGREAWALYHLFDAGAKGITPRDRPAPRWSCYVHRLRKRGLDVETLPECHSGAFAGRHGRYVLRTPLTIVSITSAGGGNDDE